MTKPKHPHRCPECGGLFTELTDGGLCHSCATEISRSGRQQNYIREQDGGTLFGAITSKREKQPSRTDL